MELKYPRIVHSEFMTHRVFSRNAASSRAIPAKKMIQAIEDDPFIPTYWGKNQSGMQAKEQLSAGDQEKARSCWLHARDNALTVARQMESIGLHKQILNRILEPFQWITVICTSTEWDNFYALRDHEDAQPEIQVLAGTMLQAHLASSPKILQPGEWHLPYVNQDELQSFGMYPLRDGTERLRMYSAARCCRVSYLLQGGEKPTPEKDEATFLKLAGGKPLHASPLEHQATPLEDPTQWCGNLRGWLQFRKTLKGENIQFYPKFRMKP
jgi:thymidylate synthase ThyX